MNRNLDFIQSMKENIFCGIYGDILHINRNNDELILHCSQPIISIHSTKENTDERFWSFESEERSTGDDVLIVNEQKTPAPLGYEVIVGSNQKYIISASSYSTEKNFIKDVSGYGFVESNMEILASLVLELEDSFVHIEAAPAIEIRITKQKPNIEDNLINHI